MLLKTFESRIKDKCISHINKRTTDLMFLMIQKLSFKKKARMLFYRKKLETMNYITSNFSYILSKRRKQIDGRLDLTLSYNL